MNVYASEWDEFLYDKIGKFLGITSESMKTQVSVDRGGQIVLGFLKIGADLIEPIIQWFQGKPSYTPEQISSEYNSLVRYDTEVRSHQQKITERYREVRVLDVHRLTADMRRQYGLRKHA